MFPQQPNLGCRATNLPKNFHLATQLAPIHIPAYLNVLDPPSAYFYPSDAHKEIDLASIMHQINDLEEIGNPNNVKVIVDTSNYALYFSRSPIPFPRDSAAVKYYKHQGIYAFRKSAILEFTKMEMEYLEASEKIECLHGK